MKKTEITKLIQVMKKLRDPINGCPWDKKQTMESIIPHTIEEVYEVAEQVYSQNYDKLKEISTEPKQDPEIEKKDKENATKLDVTKADKMMNNPAYQRMKAGDPRYADKTEGNQFAQAVQKAKAAGMKAGDKFKVGDKEYTLKDAIELAGLQLEDFYSEEEMAYDTPIDRIKNLALYQ